MATRFQCYLQDIPVREVLPILEIEGWSRNRHCRGCGGIDFRFPAAWGFYVKIDEKTREWTPEISLHTRITEHEIKMLGIQRELIADYVIYNISTLLKGGFQRPLVPMP